MESSSCLRSGDRFQGLPKFNSDALFLVDPQQRTQLDMAGLQDYIDDCLSLPPVNVDRVIQFVNTFSQANLRGEVEGSPVRITEEYVSACLKLINSRGSEAAPYLADNVHRVCARNLVEFQAYMETCFEGGSEAEVVGKGWRKSQLRGRCKDIVNFVQQRLWGLGGDSEFVDDHVIQAVLGIMCGKQFAWARHLSRLMKENIVEYRDGDEVYRSTNGLRSAQYLSMLIDFQIGPKAPPPDSSVTIFDVDEMLDAVAEQNSALSKKLAVLEEETIHLRQDAIQAATAAHSAEKLLKSQLVKAETELAQCQTDWVKDQRALSRQLKEEKAYSRIVFQSHTQYKEKCDKLWDDLKKSERQNLELLESLKAATKQCHEATEGELKDDLQELGNQQAIASGGVVPGGRIPFEAMWVAADNLYLGHFSNLFDNWNDDFPYPKWEALWWIAKDYGQSPPPPQQRSLTEYYSRNSFQMSSEPPEEVSSHPHFCKLCDRRWMWFTTGKIDAVYYNWPKISLDLSSSRACSASYYAFYEKHKDHLDPVCFRAAIFCAVLANWCSQFDLVIDANKGGQQYQDMMLYVEVTYCSSRVTRVLELMCQLQFLHDSHKNMVRDNASRWGIAEEWRRLQGSDRGTGSDDDRSKRVGKRGRRGVGPRPF